MDLEALLNELGEGEWELDTDELELDTGDWELDPDGEVPAHQGGDEESKAGDGPDTNGARPAISPNDYVATLARESCLHIVQEGQVRRAYTERQELGLFGLFFSAIYRETLRSWTNAKLKQVGKAEASVVEFDAYMGLEIAMGILPLTEIKDFWSEKRFLGQNDVAETMSRNRFECLRSHIQLHAMNSATEAYKLMDPLWHSRDLLRHLQSRFASVAVPVGAASLDENTVRTKARSRARTYLPSKPDKYGIRFYAVVGWESLYIHTIVDNGSGNTEPRNPAARYCSLFPELRRPLASTLARQDVSVKRDSASALWTAMIGHMTLTHEAPTRRRLLICDNYYTRHELAKAVLAFTDGEVRMIGTCKVKQMGKWNELEIAQSIARVKELERGSWELEAAVDVQPDWSNAQAAHNRAQKKLPAAKRTEFAPAMQIAAHAGFFIFLDKKPVVFYTNDLCRTPSQRVLPGSSPEAIELCHGLAPVRRRTEEQNLHRKTLQAPAIVAAYNIFMNGVDRVDQLRSTNPIRRKEARLEMSILTWAMDLALINAFCLMKKVSPGDSRRLSLREFKRRVAESMTDPYFRQVRRKRQAAPQRDPVQNVVGADTSAHMITPNSTAHSNGKLTCYLCSLRGLSRKSRYGCTGCLRGYHVECFTAFLYRDAFSSRSLTVRSALDEVIAASDGAVTGRARLKKNKSITTLDELTLPKA